MALRQKILGLVVIAAIYKFNPLYLRSSFMGVASSFTNLSPAQDPRSLKAAFANVTADYDQLTSLLEDFFERMPDNTTETLLREYLLIKSSRKHKFLERFFDWMLSVYRFLLPFLLVYLATLVFGGGGGTSKSDDRRLASPSGRSARHAERFTAGQEPELPLGRISSTQSLG